MPTLLIFSKEQAFGLINFITIFLFSISLIANAHYFLLLLALGLICSSFTNFLMLKVVTALNFSLLFSDIRIKSYIAALTASRKFDSAFSPSSKY